MVSLQTFPIWLYRHRWLLPFLAMSTLLMTFGVQEGFEHAQVNHFRDQSVQLPILYSYADSSLFPGDILLDARTTYVTWFYPVLGVLSRIVPLYLLMLALYVMSTGLTVTAVYYLAETLFPKGNVGLVAVLLWASWLPNPGGDFLHSSFPTHTTTAVGLQVFGLALALRKRYIPAALLLGFAANINAMTSIFIGVVWAFDLLRDRENWSLKLLYIPAFMLLAASPILWWRFEYAPSTEQIPMEDFVEVMRTRLWYAVFPFSVNVQLWLLFAGVVGLWMYAARFANPETNRRVWWMMLGIILLVLIGTIFTELIPLEMVIQLQLLRSTWVLNLFAMLYFANMIRIWLRGGRREMMLALVLTTILAAPRVVIELIPIHQPVPYELYMDFNPDGNEKSITLLGAIALVVSVFFLVWLLRRLVLEGEKRIVAGWFVFSVGLFVLPLFINTAVPHRQLTTTDAWKHTLYWIRDHTPADASFVTPPTLDGFRVYARRTSFSDWKDGTLLIFNSELALEWLDRMEALGFDEQKFTFTPLTQEQVCYIRQQYADMDYVIVFRSWGIEGESIYQNDVFAVLPLGTIPCNS